MDKELIVIGDRVLISPDDGQSRTSAGLYLPQGALEKEKVSAGTIIKVGPGYPIPDLNEMGSEPWMNNRLEGKYMPLQVKEGDYCIYLRSAAVDVEFEGKKYVVVSHASILVVLRKTDLA